MYKVIIEIETSSYLMATTYEKQIGDILRNLLPPDKKGKVLIRLEESID